MKPIGSPDTLSGLFLRLAQAVFFVLAFVCFPLHGDFFKYVVLRGLVIAVFFHAIWSVGFIMYDVFALRQQIHHLSSWRAILLAGSTLMECLTTATMSMSIEILTRFTRDTPRCSHNRVHECKLTTISVVFAFAGWLCSLFTCMALLRLRAALG